MEILVNQKLKEELKLVTGKYLWHYLYIIHCVKVSEILNKEEGCPLNLSRLRKNISYDRAHLFLNDLCSLGILTTNGSYSVGQSAKRFKLTKKLDFIMQEIEDEKLNQKLKKKIQPELDELMNDTSGYGKVIRNTKELKINKQLAFEFIENNKDLTEEQKLSYKNSVNNFENKFFVKDNTCLRLHSNITNLPSSLRVFLSYYSDFLCQVDVKCSQPTFLGLHALKISSCDKSEVFSFLEDCKNGSFYDVFSDLSHGGNRKELKKDIFKYCFFNKNYPTENKFEIRFKETYPTIFELIKKLKKEDYRNLSIMLQRMEADFIFNVVNNLEVFAVTIHDSILGKSSDIEIIKKAMEDSFLEKYNFIPKLDIENC